MSKNDESADPIGSAVGASRRPRMTQTEIAWMIGCCARIPAVLQAARLPLASNLFERSEAKFALLWRAISAAADAGRGSLPADPGASKAVVGMKCASEIAADTGRVFFGPVVEQAVLADGGLLDEIYVMPIGKEIEEQGFDLLGRFLLERQVSDPFRLALAGLGPQDTLNDPAAILSVIEKHTRDIAGIGVDPGSDAVVDADDFVPPGPEIFTTKMVWLDELLGGGQARKEAYALLGPSGGGKTALGVQLAVEGAEMQSALAAELGPDEAGHWYYFTYELDEHQLRNRVYVYGARVHADTFVKRRPFSTIDKPETMREYESDAYVNSPGNPVMGEAERISAFRKRLSGVNSRLQIVDFSGSKPGHGVGGVDEIAGYLRREQSRGKRITGVVIDYAGISVQRTVAAKNLRPEAEYSLLAGFVDSVRTKISVPMGAAAWVLHQLHGTAANRAAGAKVHHSDARGCRNFADNSDFGIQLSNRNKTTNLLEVYCTKHRRAPGREDGVVVKFRGEFGAFVTPDQDYVFDPVSRQLVPKGYLDMISPASRPLPGGKPPTTFNPLAGLS